MCNGKNMDLSIRPSWFESYLCHLTGRGYWENQLWGLHLWSENDGTYLEGCFEN